MFENKDIKKMEGNRELMQANDDMWVSVIERFQLDQELCKNSETLAQMRDYVAYMKKDKKVAHENFLNAGQLTQFRQDMEKNAAFVLKQR